MPTHTAPQAHVIWNCILPSFSLLSLQPTPPPPPPLPSCSPVCLTYMCSYPEDQIPIWNELAAQPVLWASLSLSFLFLLQFKLRPRFTVLTGKKPVQCISFLGWFFFMNFVWAVGVKHMTPWPLYYIHSYLWWVYIAQTGLPAFTHQSEAVERERGFEDLALFYWSYHKYFMSGY